MEFLSGFKNCILDIFLSAPYLFAFLFGIFAFIRSPYILRALSISFLFLNFVFSSFLLISTDYTRFSFWGCEYLYDSYSGIFVFLTSLIFLLISILSKTFIKKLYRVFYSVLILYLGLLNCAVLTADIKTVFVLIFWLILLNYFLFNSYAFNEIKKIIFKRFTFDIFCFILSFGLILWEFFRYFYVNEISFTYDSVVQNIENIDIFSVKLAFLGIIIMIFKFFNFIPFGFKQRLNNVNPLIISLYYISSLILGSVLFIRCAQGFDILFYEYENIIIAYIIFNALYFAILSFSRENVFGFLSDILSSYICIGVLCVFAFSELAFSSFVYYFVVLVITFAAAFFIFSIFAEKFKTNTLSEFKKINDRSALALILSSIGFLNLAKIPPSPMFSSVMICYFSLFSIDLGEGVLSWGLYLLLLTSFLTTYAVYLIFAKMFIFQNDKGGENFSLPNHQAIVLYILGFLIIISALCPHYLFEQIN